jgi:hypothetical protein
MDQKKEDVILPEGENIFKRQTKEKNKKTEKKPKFKILLTEEEEKQKEAKIKAKNVKNMEKAIKFFDNKGTKFKTNISEEEQNKIRALDNKLRNFLYSLTFEFNGVKRVMSDAEYINKIELFMKRENSEIITKIFTDILNTLEIKYIKILITDYLYQTQVTFQEFYTKFLMEYLKNPEKFKREINIKEFLISLRDYLKYKDVKNLNNLSLIDKLPIYDEDVFLLLKNSGLDIILIKQLLRKYLEQYLDYNGVVLDFYDFYNQFLTSEDVYNYNQRKKFDIEYREPLKQPFKEKIDRRMYMLMEDFISKKVLEIGKMKLKEAFLNVDVRLSNEYISDVITSVQNSSKNIGEFVNKLGQIVIYLTKEINLISNDIFVNRLRDNYYLPEVLINLSPEQKLPEIFLNNLISVEKIKDVSNILNNELNKFTTKFLQDILSDEYDIYKHVPMRAVKYFGDIPVFKNRSTCSNKEDIIGKSDKELVYYNENGRTYCLIIRDIAIRFKENNFLNPYTTVRLSDEFIETFNKVYLPEQNRILEKEKSYIIPTEADGEKIIITEKRDLEVPGFIEFILDDINRMERLQKEEEDIQLAFDLETNLQKTVPEEKIVSGDSYKNIILPEILKEEIDINVWKKESEEENKLLENLNMIKLNVNKIENKIINFEKEENNISKSFYTLLYSILKNNNMLKEFYDKIIQMFISLKIINTPEDIPYDDNSLSESNIVKHINLLVLYKIDSVVRDIIINRLKNGRSDETLENILKENRRFRSIIVNYNNRLKSRNYIYDKQDDEKLISSIANIIVKSVTVNNYSNFSNIELVAVKVILEQLGIYLYVYIEPNYKKCIDKIYKINSEIYKEFDEEKERIYPDPNYRTYSQRIKNTLDNIYQTNISLKSCISTLNIENKYIKNQIEKEIDKSKFQIFFMNDYSYRYIDYKKYFSLFSKNKISYDSGEEYEDYYEYNEKDDDIDYDGEDGEEDEDGGCDDDDYNEDDDGEDDDDNDEDDNDDEDEDDDGGCEDDVILDNIISDDVVDDIIIDDVIIEDNINIDQDKANKIDYLLKIEDNIDSVDNQDGNDDETITDKDDETTDEDDDETTTDEDDDETTTDEDDETTDEDDETTDEDDDETTTDEDDETTDEDDETTDEEDDETITDYGGEENKNNVKDEEIIKVIENIKVVENKDEIKCKKCNKKIEENIRLTSYIFNNNSIEEIKFCCIQCFENYNMPKIKKNLKV